MVTQENDHMYEHVGFEGQQIFSGIKERMRRVEHSFLETLSSIATPHGYDGGIFTGAGLCAVASYALLDGIKAWIDPAYSLAVKGMRIFMNKEYAGGVGMYKEVFGFHSILEVTHPIGGVIYADSTHGQLNKMWAGKFLYSSIASLGDGYKTTDDSGLFPGWRYMTHVRPITDADLYDVSEQKDKQLEFFEKTLGIKKVRYDKLVAIAGGGI